MHRRLIIFKATFDSWARYQVWMVPLVAQQAVLKTAEDTAQTRVGSIPTPSANGSVAQR